MVRVRLDGGPLDGLAFEHDQGVDKILVVTDGAHLIRYECHFEDVRLEGEAQQSLQHVTAYDLTEDFDGELLDSMRRAGSRL